MQRYWISLSELLLSLLGKGTGVNGSSVANPNSGRIRLFWGPSDDVGEDTIRFLVTRCRCVV